MGWINHIAPIKSLRCDTYRRNNEVEIAKVFIERNMGRINLIGSFFRHLNLLGIVRAEKIAGIDMGRI